MCSRLIDWHDRLLISKRARKLRGGASQLVAAAIRSRSEWIDGDPSTIGTLHSVHPARNLNKKETGRT
jgi:hypothetical protein